MASRKRDGSQSPHVLVVGETGPFSEKIAGALRTIVDGPVDTAALDELDRAFERHPWIALLVFSVEPPREHEVAAKIARARAVDPALPVIAAGEQLDAGTVRVLFHAGAIDVVTDGDLDIAVEAAGPVLRRRLARLSGTILAEGDGVPRILGESRPMREVGRLVERVAPSDATVLILGESGTGKELIARAVHALSPRKRGPFIAINCAAIPETLLENELFGHEKGSYTGANATAIGKVEAAERGTLFLDEIGEMPLPLQAKILRLLQEKTYDRIGASKTRKADIRIVAATNRELKEQVAERRFREDLYYRLSVVPLALPSLRQRREDIPIIADFVLERQAAALSRPGLRFTDAAIERMVAYRWPGNVRELENEIERAAVLARGDTIDSTDLELRARVADPDRAALARLVPLDGTLAETTDRLAKTAERIRIAIEIDECEGDRARAAERLGVSLDLLNEKLNS